MADGTMLKEGAIHLTDAEWRARLTPEQYHVLREHGTARGGAPPRTPAKRAPGGGCAACGTALFDAAAKYESGSGWPSFFEPRPGAVATNVDTSHGMRRVEVTCAGCGGHLGHVFPDGPEPTGERFCMNGAALDFRPETQA